MKKHSITILYNSPVILTFALLSLLALGLGQLTDGWTTQNLFCVYRSSLTDWLTYPRFFLHVLGHPDFAAYCSNIVMLLVVGPTAEERFGGKRILLAIALTALVTGLVLWFFFPNSALMGASGVVFMLIVLASFAGMRTGTIPLTLILVLILYLGSEIFQAVTGTAGLAQLTHIAGGVLGMIFGFTWSRGKRAVDDEACSSVPACSALPAGMTARRRAFPTETLRASSRPGTRSCPPARSSSAACRRRARRPSGGAAASSCAPAPTSRTPTPAARSRRSPSPSASAARPRCSSSAAPRAACGEIYDGTFTGTLTPGDGVAAALPVRARHPRLRGGRRGGAAANL